MRPTKHSLRWFHLPVLVVAFVLGCLASTVLASENVDFRKMASLPVLVKDEQGNPIAGASVMAYAMRMKEREGHGYWNEKLLGRPKIATSDKSGLAVVRYPIHVQYGPQVLTTRLVTFQVTHTDFVQSVVHFELTGKQPEAVLKPGCEVQLSAIEAKGIPIEDFGVIVAGPYAPADWGKAEGSGRRTRAMRDGIWQTMLVKIQTDGPTLFSSVVPLRVQPQQTVRLRNLKLTAGTQVRGKLSDNVTRPVRGYVLAVSVPIAAEDTWSETDPSLGWHDWVEVSADGSFEFQSLPRGGQLQLIGICDGWISSTSVPEAGSFVMGQLFEMDHNPMDVELAMEPTGTLELKLLTDDGKPFTEGDVACSPNQRYYKGGSTLLGRRYRSETQIRNQLLPPEQQVRDARLDMTFPFHQPVGKDGVVRLTGLPIGRRHSVVLIHGKFRFATPDADENRREIVVELPSPEPIRKEVIVKSD